jgi:hypothetical protein
MVFAAVFVTYAVYLRIFADRVFYFDAANYWALAGSFGSPGHFSLLDFGPSIRGYSLPLLNRLLATIASNTGMGAPTVVQLFGALEIALLGTVLLPRLVRILAPAARVTPARVLFFNAIVFLFWRDHLGLPLSDFPALTLVVIALLAIARRSPIGYLSAGLALGLAWNIRQAYVVTLVLLLILVALRAGVRRTPLVAAAAVGLVLLGVAVVSLPQSLINHRSAQSWSPTILAGKGIVLADLTYGMRAQRVDGNVGPEYAFGAVFYVDPSTQALLDRAHLTLISSYAQYARIVAHHPAEMAGGWARRVFNGLDVQYATPYVHDLDARHEWFSLIDYTLIFFAGVRLLVPVFRRRLGQIAWPEVAAVCAACIPSIPFAMESRYLLPVQFVIYALVAFGAGTRAAFAELGRGERVALAVCYVGFLLLCITLSTSTFALRAPAS